MPEQHTQAAETAASINGACPSELEVRLRHIFGEQQRLRELLDRMRAELDLVNAELRRFQDEYCTDAAREDEYLDCLERIHGVSFRIDPREIEEAMANPQGIEDLLAELERQAESAPAQEVK
jgi:predicted nuclease with TOPRIM domain